MFEKFKADLYRYKRATSDISLSKSMLYISKKIYIKLGKPERVTILIDTENKAIKLEEATGKEGWKLSKTTSGKGNRFVGTTNLAKIMPIGRYNRVKDNRMIFEYENQN